jgi:hypothetical protein
MPPITNTTLITLPLLLLLVYFLLIVTDLIHETLHLFAIWITATPITGITITRKHLILPHPQIHFKPTSPRTTRIIALYPTIITTGILVYIFIWGTITGWLDFVIKTGILALIGLPSITDIKTALYPTEYHETTH